MSSTGLDKRESKILQRLVLLVGGRSRSQESFDSYFSEVCSQIRDLDNVTNEELNKLLVAAGFNRVDRGFYEFFCSLDPENLGLPGSFDRRLTAWRQRVMIRYGNFRYPFRRLSSGYSAAELVDHLQQPSRDLSSRRAFGGTLKSIEPEDKPLLGFLAGGNVRKLKKLGPRDSVDEEYIARAEKASAVGEANLYEYCTMEDMDVYVATSMRETEDFYSVSRFVGDVFADNTSPDLRRVAFFDPTLSSHKHRIIKGLVEGLMLKRSMCTVYLAQESDTLGKDAELATTLVQGKPVIVYIPRIEDTDAEIDRIRADMERAAADDPFARDEDHPEWKRLAIRYAKTLPSRWYSTRFATTEKRIASAHDFDEALESYVKALHEHYDGKDGRVVLFRDRHPLGIQVALSTGVPNGILVVRSPQECKAVLDSVIQGILEFGIEATDEMQNRHATDEMQNRHDDLSSDVHWRRVLREAQTGCVYRVAIGEDPIANAFWNWYPNAAKKPRLTLETDGFE